MKIEEAERSMSHFELYLDRLATFLLFLPTALTGHIEMYRTISNGLENTPFDRDSDR